MRGRPNNPAKAKAKARAHAKRAHFCDCGKVVRGNGGRAGHERMHEARGDGHRSIGREEWEARFGGQPPASTCYRDGDSAVCDGSCAGTPLTCAQYAEARVERDREAVLAAPGGMGSK